MTDRGNGDERTANEVVKITVSEIVPSGVYLSIRLRGEKAWTYFDNLHAAPGQCIVITDGEVEARAPEGTTVSMVPRSFDCLINE
ncbi:MAG: hypothetical protein ACYSVY_00035 [Planctomycetota bacterium]|jgi:hypothetical protein